MKLYKRGFFGDFDDFVCNFVILFIYVIFPVILVVVKVFRW